MTLNKHAGLGVLDSGSEDWGGIAGRCLVFYSAGGHTRLTVRRVVIVILELQATDAFSNTVMNICLSVCPSGCPGLICFLDILALLNSVVCNMFIFT